jgi:hypothetical protein
MYRCRERHGRAADQLRRFRPTLAISGWKLPPTREAERSSRGGLYAEAIDCSSTPWVSADAMVGQAAVARRRGDLLRSRALLDAAAGHYRLIDLPAGPPRVLAGLAWWALAADHLRDAAAFAAEAADGASASAGEPSGRPGRGGKAWRR